MLPIAARKISGKRYWRTACRRTSCRSRWSKCSCRPATATPAVTDLQPAFSSNDNGEGLLAEPNAEATDGDLRPRAALNSSTRGEAAAGCLCPSERRATDGVRTNTGTQGTVGSRDPEHRQPTDRASLLPINLDVVLGAAPGCAARGRARPPARAEFREKYPRFVNELVDLLGLACPPSSSRDGSVRPAMSAITPKSDRRSFQRHTSRWAIGDIAPITMNHRKNRQDQTKDLSVHRALISRVRNLGDLSKV